MSPGPVTFVLLTVSYEFTIIIFVRQLYKTRRRGEILSDYYRERAPKGQARPVYLLLAKLSGKRDSTLKNPWKVAPGVNIPGLTPTVSQSLR
jgi:hypothetical protein